MLRRKTTTLRDARRITRQTVRRHRTPAENCQTAIRAYRGGNQPRRPQNNAPNCPPASNAGRKLSNSD
nr:MAG TPA: hypothetical protein [Caudoviricetes sp.]